MAVINVFEVGSKVGAPLDNRSSVRTDNSGQQAMLKQNAQTVNILQEGANNFYEKLITADVMQGNTEYNERLNALKTELMQNKEGNALKNMQLYEEGRQKIYNDILKNGPQSLRYGEGYRLFTEMAEKDWSAKREQMALYQAKEAEKYQNTQATLQLQNTLKDVADTYDNPFLLNSYMERAAFVKSNQYSNYGEERMMLEADAARSAVVKTAIDAAIANSDYDNAANLLNNFSRRLTPEEKNAYTKTIYQYKENEYLNTTAAQLAEMYDYDENAIMAAIDNGNIPGYELELSKEGDTWITKDGTVSLEGIQDKTKAGIEDIAELYKSITGEQLYITSGTDSTNIHAAGERSHGGGWKIDIASDWLADPANRQSFIQALEQRGIVVGDEYSAPSAKSTGGHLDLDFTDYAGKVKQRMNFNQKQELKNNVKSIISDNTRRKKQAKAKMLETVSENIFAWKEQGLTYSDAMMKVSDIAKGYKDTEMLSSMQNMVKAVFTESTGAIYDEVELANMIKSNRFGGDGEKFMTFVANNFGGKYIAKASKLWNDYLNKDGEFKGSNENLKLAIFGKTTLKQAEAAQWHGTELALHDFRINFIKEKGREPSYNELVSEGKKYITKNSFGTYRNIDDFFSTDIEASQADLYNAGIRQAVKLDNNQYELTFTDGSKKTVTASEFNEVYLGNED